MQKYKKKSTYSSHFKKNMYICISNTTTYMERITAIIITQDEERNIERCLASLEGVADEVVVVDSGSTDRTQELCIAHGARFVVHPWEGYDRQKNYADSLASHPWILSIDADEALSPTLRESIAALKKNPSTAPTDVFDVNRLNNYCGHWIHHSGWYPDRKTRLFHRDVMEWDGTVHEMLRRKGVPPCTSGCEGVHRGTPLQGDLLHYSYYSVADHAARQTKYAVLAAHKAFEQGKRTHRTDLWVKPAWTFFRNYFLRLGFLDGQAGYLVCRMAAVYTLIKYARLHELTKGKN